MLALSSTSFASLPIQRAYPSLRCLLPNFPQDQYADLPRCRGLRVGQSWTTELTIVSTRVRLLLLVGSPLTDFFITLSLRPLIHPLPSTLGSSIATTKPNLLSQRTFPVQVGVGPRGRVSPFIVGVLWARYARKGKRRQRPIIRLRILGVGDFPY